MKIRTIPARALRAAIACYAAVNLMSCATFDHPLTRHDMDGDGAISHAEHQQNHMQYNIARRQRVDEYDRARQVYRHVDNIGDVVGGASRVVRNFRYFGY